ncbi:RNase J family beta-CASP ribonuclease [Limosilactobacillus reuteri]|jgi:ribonuclease J|uniref:Ribonuclease J n=3 Tax=Limosilactobacillus reuteri TaxID=1598 RepID=A0A143PXG6_LIMRT|nr:ribonuclease J [Limosilactobacillus reuteri]CCC03044.1 metallo-beta-lactamase superfamily protein [Limosilactobacillus reuteri subsp. suis]AGN99466.1 metallo-beta-lactamase superfamily protein [Limosilactobacillus reuteri I5007]AMY13447.1 RNase J family beta-CASP ribonuclease [Limosilactobacillus reuteri]MCC4340068.1 ribonuclease J [Limosilactobacillus reuteri]MCC4346565.1 ribonuclease J [Limosilactobacillus reuteri]
MDNNIKIIPFGGVRENGKNMYAVEIEDQIFILDTGLKYPENELMGIDVVIPDWEYLREHKDKIVGVFLTHGHADSIGALPYFLMDFNVPVFGSEMTIALAKLAVKSHKEVKKFNDFHVVDASTAIDFNDVTVSFFQTTHTIPETLGVVLETRAGNIVYTGDFKFDQTAKKGYQTDLARLAEIGSQGVLALLSDSAGAGITGASAREQDIGDYIKETFKYQNGRIIVASVASNIMRVQQIINAAVAVGRKIVLSGKDIEQIIDTAMSLGKLHLPDDLFISRKEAEKLEPNQVVILETGKMGEPIKSLQQIANGDNPNLQLTDTDLVFVTTTPSYAQETEVQKTKDMIYRTGAEVKFISDDLNPSGHANQNDEQLMLNFMKPKFFIPIQGEYRLLDRHAELAEEVGVPKENIFLVNKGDVLTYKNGKFHVGEHIDVSNTMIDGTGVGDIGNIVLRDRRVLSEDGIFVVVATIDRKKKKIVARPQITSRGFVFVKTNRQLMQQSADLVEKIVQENLDQKEFDWSHLKQDVRDKLNRFLFDQTKRHPVILPVIMEINQHQKKIKNNVEKKEEKSAKPRSMKEHHRGRGKKRMAKEKK